MVGKQLPLAERFWAKVEKRGADECWLWQGGKSHNGYGQISCGRGRNLRAHRVSWEIHNGPIPDDVLALHSCDMPACVNPAHLWLGTQLENMQDKHAKGRARYASGEDNGMAKLTAEQVALIRTMPGSSYEVSKQFGVSSSNIRVIRAGKKWKVNGACHAG